MGGGRVKISSKGLLARPWVAVRRMRVSGHGRRRRGHGRSRIKSIGDTLAARTDARRLGGRHRRHGQEDDHRSGVIHGASWTCLHGARRERERQVRRLATTSLAGAEATASAILRRRSYAGGHLPLPRRCQKRAGG